MTAILLWFFYSLVRNKIFNGIGILWGGGILFNWLFSGSQASGSSAYQSG
jgi:hypothetical protein